MLGQVYNWDGTSRSATFEELDFKYSSTSNSQLKLHLLNSVSSLRAKNAIKTTSLLENVKLSFSNEESVASLSIELVNHQSQIRALQTKVADQTYQLQKVPISHDDQDDGHDKVWNLREYQVLSNSVNETSNQISILLKQKNEISDKLARRNALGTSSLSVGHRLQQRGTSALMMDRKFSLFRTYSPLWSVSGHMDLPAYCVTYDISGRFILTGADDYLVTYYMLYIKYQ